MDRYMRLHLHRFLCLMGAMLFLVVIFPYSYALASPHQTLAVPQQQDLARAGVSVVRLLVSYTQSGSSTQVGTPPTTQQCTGLGVLVGSGVNANNQQENWILTDASLLNATKAVCVPNQPTATLSSLDVYMSTAYNSIQQPTPIATIKAGDLKGQTQSQDNLVVFPFRSPSIQLLPYININTDTDVVDPKQEAALYLSKGTDGLPTVPPSSITGSGQVATFQPLIQQYLTPMRQAFSSPQGGSSVQREAGQPVVDSIGHLTGMALANGSLVDHLKIGTLLQKVDALKNRPANLVHDDWDSGITSYYAGIANNDTSKQQDLTKAQAVFTDAVQKNPQFEGAQTFAGAAKDALSSSNSGTKVGPASTPATDPVSSILSGKIGSNSIWMLSIVGLLLVIAIVIVVSIIFARSRARKMRLQDELAEASRKAELDAPRIQEEEQRQQKQNWSLQPAMQAPPPSGSSSLVHGDPARNTPLPAVPEMRCPNCGEPVAKGTPRCPNCSSWLSPSDSGLHYRLATTQTPPPPPPPPMVAPGAGSIVDQPTLVPSGSVPDQPTVEIRPGASSNGQFEGETTEIGLQRWNGRNIALAVGTNTNPGIKRRYKPNEDSLFAAQAIRDPNLPALQVGLFVIADGMGGHANGQDASRRAIQTIIDFLLPKLMKISELQDTELEHLLGEGVQQANQAVHQNNVELRADMGTTMTAALIINASAYVANVGDSRTYLYREGIGLKKVTNDHSVVASLVEAGIIKPDDIYTHPKRNQIYRSLGEKPVVEVDTFTVKLMPGDKLLLCSDGLWDMVRDPKIEDVVKTSTLDPNRTAEALIQAALDGGGEDNVSVIVVSVQENAKQELVPGFHLIAKPESTKLPQL